MARSWSTNLTPYSCSSRNKRETRHITMSNTKISTRT